MTESKTKNKPKFSQLNKIFETKKVFVFYLACNILTVLTILGSIISTIFFDLSLSIMVDHIFNCVAAIFFYNIPVIVKLRYSVHIPSLLEIMVAFISIAHFVLGTIYGFYEASLIFDKILHTISGLMFAIIGFSLINLLNTMDEQIIKLSPFFVALFSFCFALAVGYLWELLEFVMDTIIGLNMQRWQGEFYTAIVDGEEKLIRDYGRGSGLIDTTIDMIVNAIGALFVSLLGYIWLRKKSPKIQRLLITIKDKEAVPVSKSNDENSINQAKDDVQGLALDLSNKTQTDNEYNSFSEVAVTSASKNEEPFIAKASNDINEIAEEKSKDNETSDVEIVKEKSKDNETSDVEIVKEKSKDNETSDVEIVEEKSKDNETNEDLV